MHLQPRNPGGTLDLGTDWGHFLDELGRIDEDRQDSAPRFAPDFVRKDGLSEASVSFAAVDSIEGFERLEDKLTKHLPKIWELVDDEAYVIPIENKEPSDNPGTGEYRILCPNVWQNNLFPDGDFIFERNEMGLIVKGDDGYPKTVKHPKVKSHDDDKEKLPKMWHEETFLFHDPLNPSVVCGTIYEILGYKGIDQNKVTPCIARFEPLWIGDRNFDVVTLEGSALTTVLSSGIDKFFTASSSANVRFGNKSTITEVFGLGNETHIIVQEGAMIASIETHGKNAEIIVEKGAYVGRIGAFGLGSNIVVKDGANVGEIENHSTFVG